MGGSSREPASRCLVALCGVFALAGSFSCTKKESNSTPRDTKRVELKSEAGDGPEKERLLARGRAVAQQFEAQLKATLQSSLQKDGPTKAIEVCSIEAPRIALQINEQTKSRVRRISAKSRNPGNAPSPSEQEILRSFEEQLRVEPSRTPETVRKELRDRALYFKAIRVGGLCLTCHGQSLSEPVRGVLSKMYPEDRAIGYNPGELRGALVVEWNHLSPQL